MVYKSRFWQRLRKNRPAMWAMGYLLLAVFFALFGYLIVPDNSPNANVQLPECAYAAPGSKVVLLALNPEVVPAPRSFLKKVFMGFPVRYKPVPVEASSIELTDRGLRALRLGGVPVEVDRAALWKSDQPFVHRSFPLGADVFGRCIFSRLILGFRVSLFVGALAVAIALTLGIFLGAIGGYLGGRVDALVMLLINTVWSIPTLLLVFAVVLALGRSVSAVFLAVGMTLWVDVARIVRGQVMSLREQPFAEAAYNLGLPSWQIVWRHIIPNLMGPVLVVLSSSFAIAILVESGLSYLGFGVQPPTPSWGTLLYENYGMALSGRWVSAMAPAVAIALTVWAFNVLGNGMRDALE